MKIIKKIAAIMLSVMMVLGMCSVVGAEGTTSEPSATTGSITISKAAHGETYNIYRILDLESYSGSRETGNYAYKLRTDTVTGSTGNWSEFIKSPGINSTYVILDGEYVTWKDGAKAEEFAKKALEYAKESTTKIKPDATQKLEGTDISVTFSGLPLGYYLVETSVGTVLALNTTDTNVTIEEKNGVPSVEKKVKKGSDYDKENTASIGDRVEFQTTITAQPGAQNYVLHDKMSDGLTFAGSVSVTKGGQALEAPRDYSLVTSTSTPAITDGCTFHIEFTPAFCDTLKANDQIIVTYSATLNKSAVIAGNGNKNETWLTYGDSSETTHDETTTKTFEIPVFKYTNKNGTEEPLEGAEFTLTRDGETVPIKLVKVAAVAEASDDVYRVAMKSETGETVISDGKVTTSSTGKFTIKGLDAGTYHLTETKQPDGYNKLTTPVTIIISDTGTITVNGTNVNPVKVENKSGSILPSTGGMGTTLFYIFGAILVIGSGVVLITKKRMK